MDQQEFLASYLDEKRNSEVSFDTALTEACECLNSKFNVLAGANSAIFGIFRRVRTAPTLRDRILGSFLVEPRKAPSNKSHLFPRKGFWKGTPTSTFVELFEVHLNEDLSTFKLQYESLQAKRLDCRDLNFGFEGMELFSRLASIDEVEKAILMTLADDNLL